MIQSPHKLAPKPGQAVGTVHTRADLATLRRRVVAAGAGVPRRSSSGGYRRGWPRPFVVRVRPRTRSIGVVAPCARTFGGRPVRRRLHTRWRGEAQGHRRASPIDAGV